MIHRLKEITLFRYTSDGIHIIGPAILVFFLFANFLTPTFPAITRGSLYFGTLIILGIVGLLILLLIHLNTLQTHKRVIYTASTLGAAFMALTAFSLAVDYSNVVFSDYIELLKPITALLIFLGFFAAVNTVDGIKKVVKGYSVLFIIVAAIGLLEAYFGLHVITHILYTRPRDILMGKAVSPFGITYFYATFMLLAATFYFSRFAVEKKISGKVIFLFLLCSAALIATQSRTLFLSYIGMIGFFITAYIFYPFPGSSRIFKTFAPVILLVVFAIIAFFDVIAGAFSYLYIGISHLIKSGINPEADGSANIRIAQILWALENAKGYAIFGSGIGKGYQRLLESFYALYIYRYGFVGIALYIGIAIAFLVKAYRAAKMALYRRERNLFAFFMALHVFIILLPVTSLASVITDQYVFMMLYYGNFGLTLKYLYLTRQRKRLPA